MKMKKFVLAASSLLVISCLTGCNNDAGDQIVDPDYQLEEPGKLFDGFTSLANQNANGPVDADGNYTAGGKKFKVKDTFKTTYATEIGNDYLNYLINTWTYNSYHYCNMVDGLVENDKYGNVVGAIALGYKVTPLAEGKEKWTFQLRENAEWVNNATGQKVADVTAYDFVAAAKYVLNPANGSGTSAMYTNWVDGAAAYMKALGDYQAGKSQTEPDFATVGVKATNKYILEYTLESSTPYYLSCLTYSPYLPVYEKFLEAEGTEFGKTVNDVLVNGAFRITTHVNQSKMVYTKNTHYYDRDHVYVNHVERKYVPGTSTLDTTRTWFESGIIDSFTVNHDDAAGWSKYVTGADNSGSLKNPYDPNCNSIQSYGDATYVGYFNFNRTFYEYPQGQEKTPKQKQDAAEAVLNTNFRKGFLYGLDVVKELKRFDPEEPGNYLMRGFTNKELASAGGKDYTEYVNAEYNKQFSSENPVSLIGIDNGSDPIYNEAKGRQYFAAAKEELAAKGVTFPVKIDFIGSMKTQIQAYEREMIATVEAAATLDDTNHTKVMEINYMIPSSDTQNSSWGSKNDNFDFSMWSGWGPDYADPNTYLHCYTIYGDMLKHNGLPVQESELETKVLGEFLPERYQNLVTGSGTDKNYSAAIAQLQQDCLGTYAALYEAGAAVTDPDMIVERFEKFAVAEIDLIYGEAIVIPWFSENGYYASVSKTIPWQAGRATYGLTGDKFKNVIVTDTAMSKTDRAAVTEEYEAGK